jgi:hypothetical protein
MHNRAFVSASPFRSECSAWGLTGGWAYKFGVLDEGESNYAAYPAARNGHLGCLKFLLEKFPDLLTDSLLMSRAAAGSRLDVLQLPLAAGCPWNGWEPEFAEDSNVVRFCLQHIEPGWWESGASEAMDYVINLKRVGSMELLYFHGYEQHRRSAQLPHPAVYASRHGNLECMQVAVKHSGPPDPKLLCTLKAAEVGEAMLRYVRGLGADFHEGTADAAASRGNAGALQFALENGAPFSMQTFHCAVDCVDCLQCLLQHASAVGLPAEYLRDEGTGPRVKSLAMLRYIEENMRPAWARSVMAATAQGLADKVKEALASLDHEKIDWLALDVDWRLVVYIARRLKAPPPAPLDQMVVVRRDRAVALAGVFTAARKLAEKHPLSRCQPLWDAMASLPDELRERIAAEAGLIVSWEDLKPARPRGLARFTDAG